MAKPVHETVKRLSQAENIAALKGIRRGLERETLRVTPDAGLSATGHPEAFGAPLTHSWITTDYAESMLEFITPAGTDAVQSLEILSDIHRQAYKHLGPELLWPLSMPCKVEDEDAITLAHYGGSRIGKQKVRYRQGLKERYGSMMQIISGVHYNFSMPDHFWPILQKIKGDRRPLQDFISDSYFGLIRNFIRLGWLIPYLFGASPVVDRTFVNGSRSEIPLEPLGPESKYLPYATSLRVSDLGYSSPEQDDLSISYNSPAEFIRDLQEATGQSERSPGGSKNRSTLQEESELYAPIRPKRVTGEGENLTHALYERGVQYVEVRSLDINPYSAVGIDLDQIRFLDVLLTYCLLEESPKMSDEQLRTAKQNQQQVAKYGRKPAVELVDNGRPRVLSDWAGELFIEMEKIADLLDIATDGSGHRSAWECQLRKLKDPSLTPSARLLGEMAERGLDLDELAIDIAQTHRRRLLAAGYKQVQGSEFLQEAVTSRLKLRALEYAETCCFDDVPVSEKDGAPVSSDVAESSFRHPAFPRKCSGTSLPACRC